MVENVPQYVTHQLVVGLGGQIQNVRINDLRNGSRLNGAHADFSHFLQIDFREMHEQSSRCAAVQHGVLQLCPELLQWIRVPILRFQFHKHLTGHTTHQHHEFVNAPLIDGDPFVAHCFQEHPKELNADFWIVKHMDEWRQLIGQILLRQRFVWHPHAVVQTFPQPQTILVCECCNNGTNQNTMTSIDYPSTIALLLCITLIISTYKMMRMHDSSAISSAFAVVSLWSWHSLHFQPAIWRNESPARRYSLWLLCHRQIPRFSSWITNTRNLCTQNRTILF